MEKIKTPRENNKNEIRACVIWSSYSTLNLPEDVEKTNKLRKYRDEFLKTSKEYGALTETY